MASTRVEKLFSNGNLMGLLDWFADNSDQVLFLKVMTIDGRVIEGKVVQLTRDYCAVGYSDLSNDAGFSSTIVMLSAISSIQFSLT